MATLVTEKVATNTEKFLASFRLGVDFGDKAHGLAVVRGNDVVLGVTLLDESASDLKKRRQLRRGRRTRESRRQRLARFRQWCLRNHLPDPDPYFNSEINSVVWPPNREGKPPSALDRFSEGQKKEQGKICHRALRDDASWQRFLDLSPEVVRQWALINPFIARRLAREGKASPLIFVRALWHLFEHRGFDWYRRVRGDEDEVDILESKDALIRHLKTLVLPTEEDRKKVEEEVRKRDEEGKRNPEKAKPWLEDPEVQDELRRACERGKGFPTQRRLNPPRHFVEAELHECLRSLPLDKFGGDFARQKGRPPLPPEQKREVAFRGLKKLLNWNRREPRFDNRQLRGCTWCAAQGIHRNTPRKKNVIEWSIRAAIQDIKVAAGEAAKAAEADAEKQKKVTRRQWAALNAATRWLNPPEYDKVWELVSDRSLRRDDLKERLKQFFQQFARLPKRVFVEEGGQLKKKPKLHDPYEWHREELLNLADGLHKRTRLKGRVRLCEDCLKLKAETPPDQLQPPVGESEVILSQRQLKARCKRLVDWIKRNLKEWPVEYIRIEAVLPRPEEKTRLKAEAAEQEAEQTPKERLKFRLMEEVGARCGKCSKPYRERERKGPESNRDKAYCQCPRPDLEGVCAYCGQFFPNRDLQIEHIYPKNPINIAGGIGPNAQINKTVACRSCNQSEKQNRLPFDYFRNVVGGNSWEEWKRRVDKFNWSPTKRRIAFLEEYRLPEELGDIALARTRLVHRYLRQNLAALYFPARTRTLKDPNSTIEQRNEAKVFLDQRLSTPAGWLTSQCRLDWEHREENGHVIPLVPRKSPLLSPEQREKRLRESLAKARNEKHIQDIREGHAKRAKIEEQLRKVEKTAVCDRTNLNHHWIDASVLASLPPQANQPVEMGGLWIRRGHEVRADSRFAPRAAQFLERWGDGSVIFDLRNRLPRFRARQQETSLYGEHKAKIHPIIYEAVGNLRPKDTELIVSSYWREVFRMLCQQEYDFPKKRSQESEEGGEGEKSKTERRKPREDETLPPEAWIAWAREENQKRRERGKGEVSIPKRLRIYFEKLTPNEKVTLAGWGPRSADGTVPIPEDPALSKRGIPKPKRVTRMTPVGSHAVINPDTGDLTVILNPWKRHVEKTDAPERAGLRVHKGECIWLAKAKDGPGWYRIIEMSPAKQEVPGKTRGPKLKTEPAWLNVNELARVQEKKRDKWEVDLSASQVKNLFSDRQLRVKRDLADLPGLVEEFASLLGSHGHRPRTEPGA